MICIVPDTPVPCKTHFNLKYTFQRQIDSKLVNLFKGLPKIFLNLYASLMTDPPPANSTTDTDTHPIRHGLGLLQSLLQQRVL